MSKNSRDLAEEMSKIPTDLAEEEVVSGASLKRVGSSNSEKWNHLSKSKKSSGKKHVLDLPNDLAEEVLSRVPVTSLRKVRTTCKTWNALSRCKSFAEKHLALVLEREFDMVVMMTDYKLSLMSLNLDEQDSSGFIKPRGTLISLDPEDRVDVSKVFHCNGLLLCLFRGQNNLVLWNPFLGQTRWIDVKPYLHKLSCYSYAIGYDRSTESLKILRFVNRFLYHAKTSIVEFNIYDLNSTCGGSWRVLDFGSTQFWNSDLHNNGVSLKGDTYWFARDNGQTEGCFLICFDFTRERFGAPLPLPPSIRWCHPDTMTLSSVRQEQLALLFQQWDTLMLEIWITTKIDPNDVSWSNKFFLQVHMTPLTGYQFPYKFASFFIDEEKKVAVVFCKDKDDVMDPTRNVAYIIGVDGSMKEVDLGESPHKHLFPRVCHYVPSLLTLT